DAPGAVDTDAHHRLQARITHTGGKQADLYATFGARFVTPLAITRATAGKSGWCMAEVRRVAAEAHPHRHTHAGRLAAASAFEDALD
ncbi:hypothetical protein AB4142_33290, partial [Variovorax sp. 2RAF20]